MNTVLKRAVQAVAAKKAFDAFQKARRPQKRSIWSRLALPAAIAAGGGVVAYLGTTGRLQRLIEQLKKVSGRSSPEEASTEPTVSLSSSDTATHGTGVGSAPGAVSEGSAAQEVPPTSTTPSKDEPVSTQEPRPTEPTT